MDEKSCNGDANEEMDYSNVATEKLSQRTENVISAEGLNRQTQETRIPDVSLTSRELFEMDVSFHTGMFPDEGS